MIPADAVLAALGRAGFRAFSGVPCSFLTPLIDALVASEAVDYVGANNEGDAVAFACGAALGGARAVAFFQNSGLGNAVNPLTSLATTFELPILVFVTLRGDPSGEHDEPQHDLMGRITRSMLALMEITSEPFPGEPSALGPALMRAVDCLQRGRSFAFVVPKGAIGAVAGSARARVLSRPQVVCSPAPRARFDPDAALAAIQAATTEDDILIATTGYTGRALYAQGDRANQFYMVGSMGCAAALGLGLARVRPKRRVVVLDGDGALLMRLGVLSMLGSERPANLVHVLLDNGVHDSTGAQATVSPGVDFAAVATACGYPRAALITDLAALAAELRPQGLAFLHVPTLPRTNKKLPRPANSPAALARRFQTWLGV